MADLYDEQFRRRVAMHILVCDPVSAEIINALVRYHEKAEQRVAELKQQCKEHK